MTQPETCALEKGLTEMNRRRISPTGALWLMAARSPREGETIKVGSERMGTSVASSCQVLRRLEVMGLVNLLRKSRDRRLITVELTEKGRATLARIEAAFGKKEAA